jgi:hypothetical protein
VRTNPVLQELYTYSEATNPEGHQYDGHALDRYRLLVALQFGFQAGDRGLIKFLFEQEIVAHEKAPFQGLGEPLQLGAYLLATFREVENVWLFVQAKLANFDTYCGFDGEFIVSAGILPTYAYVERSSHELKSRFWEKMGATPQACYIEEEDLQSWWETVNQSFPRSLDQFSLEDEINLAIDLRETEVLKEKLIQWKQQQTEWTEDSLSKLACYEKSTGHVEGEIHARERIAALKTDPWAIASELEELSSLYLQANLPDRAWATVQKGQSFLSQIEDWKLYGLGRSYMETTINIILHINNCQDAISQQAFQWVSQRIIQMKNLHLNLIRKMADASKLMNNEVLWKRFDDLHILERGKLDKMLGKL